MYRETGDRDMGADVGLGGCSLEAPYHLYQVLNKTKYETGACGLKSVQ